MDPFNRVCGSVYLYVCDVTLNFFQLSLKMYVILAFETVTSEVEEKKDVKYSMYFRLNVLRAQFKVWQIVD